MSAHTPGPWHWDSDPIKGDELGRIRYRVVTRGKTITQCYYSSADESTEADARLIAAAPDLLEALKATLATMQTQRQREDGSFHISAEAMTRLWDAVVLKGEAAIAAATGSQS